MSDSDPFQKVSLDTLRNLLNIHGEANNLDFKQTFSLSSQKERAELVRDIIAFANTEGGGHIVFGVVDKTFEPVGLPANVPHIDTTTIYNAISKYISANIPLMAAEYEIEYPTGSEKKRFGILYVAKYPSIVVPRCDVAYEEDKGEKKKTTEGSPLYIEDLLRLCSVLSPEVAITEWKNRKGDEARQYALQREFDELTPSARKIVVACCIPGVPVSLTEIQAITGLSQDQVMSEMQAIQNLFLISRPRLIDGEHRFDVNANTRRLILHIFEKKDLLSRLQERYKGLLGQQGVQGKSDIASYIRKAISLQHLGKHEEAEHLLLKTLDRYPNNPDLTAQLGEVYSRWQPRRRRADAREQFKRAAQLKCSHESMYRVWANMESEDKEWNAAIEAAETGIKLTSTPSKELYFLAGMAHTRYGQDLMHGLHVEKARKQFDSANELLLKGLKDPEELNDYNERRVNSRIFRALVLNYEELSQLDEMHQFLNRWLSEHQGDPYAISEGERLENKYPQLKNYK